MKLNSHENMMLEMATMTFFPKDGRWSSSCFNRSNALEIKYLPCHLRDNLWLSLMLKKEEELFGINFIKIYYFVSNSSLFQRKRNEYEQEIVKFQISWMMNGGEGWITKEEYGGSMVFLSPQCDLAFRKGIVDTLSRIGMNRDAIEEGIEKNAKWRDILMDIAFSNEYEPVQAKFKGDHNHYDDTFQDEKNVNLIKLEPADLEFKNTWLKMRKYEYYQNHKSSVDKYGKVEPCMLLTDEEITAIKIYLAQKDKERKEQIERFKAKKNISQRVLRK